MVAALVPWTSASAAHVARIDVRPVQVAPGGVVNVAGPPGWAPTPVSIRWNAIDGEVLGTFPTTPGANASFGPGTVTIPNGAPGIYELVGTQDIPAAQTAVRGVPARARIQVAPGGGSGAVPTQTGTPPLNALETLDEEDGASVPALALVGLGVFAVTLALGLLVGSALRGRAARPSAEPAKLAAS
ncbi:MAG: hypothetical protein ACRD2W_10990 [Acidimicrobiales bacterium]